MRFQAIPLTRKSSILQLICLTSTIARNFLLSSQDSQDHRLKKRCLPAPECLNEVFTYFLDIGKSVRDQLGGVSHESAQRQWEVAVYHEPSPSPLTKDNYWDGKDFQHCHSTVVHELLRGAAKSNRDQSEILTRLSEKLIEPISNNAVNTEINVDKISDPLNMAVWHQSRPNGSTLFNGSLVSKRIGENIQTQFTPTSTNEQYRTLQGYAQEQPESPSKSKNMPHAPVSEINLKEHIFQIENHLSFNPIGANPNKPPFGFTGVYKNVEILLDLVKGMDEDLSELTSVILRLLVVTLGQKVFEIPEWDIWRDIIFGKLISLAYFERVAQSKETVTGITAAKDLLEQENWWAFVKSDLLLTESLNSEKKWWMDLKDKLSAKEQIHA